MKHIIYISVITGVYLSCVIFCGDVYLRPAEPSVIENGSVSLTCVYNGTDTVKYYAWYRRVNVTLPVGILTGSCMDTGIVSINSSQYNFTCPTSSSCVWTIIRVNRQNLGDWYQCHVETSSGLQDRDEITLRVIVPLDSVTMTLPLEDMIDIEENTTTTFQCVTSGSLPGALVEWFTDMGTLDDPTDDYQISTGVSTSVTTENKVNIITSTLAYSFLRSDNGHRVYCRAYVPDNRTSTHKVSARKIQLNVLYGPDELCLEVPTVNTFTEGDRSVSIRCSAECYPSCAYVWLNGSRAFSNNEILSLSTVSRYHAGNYTFEAGNTAKTYFKLVDRRFTLIIRYAPDVSIQFSSQNYSEGSTLTLFCRGKGVPASYTYTGLTQTVADIIIPNPNRALAGTYTNSSIHFPSLQLQDSGNYSCKMNNGILDLSGKLEQTMSAELLVEVQPKILQDKLIITGVQGGSITVQVPFYCYPAPQSVTFFRHGLTVIRNDSRYSTLFTEADFHDIFYSKEVTLHGYKAILTIVDTKEEDFVNYTCVVQNSRGATNVSVFVIAESVPLIPKTFLIASNASYFVWERDFNGGHPQTFVIQISKEYREKWTNLTSVYENDDRFRVNNTFYKAEISDLEPGTYVARLIAFNSVGPSEPRYLNETFTIATNFISDRKTHEIEAVVGGSVSAILVIIVVAVVILVWRHKTGKTIICFPWVSRSQGSGRAQKTREKEDDDKGSDKGYYNLENVKEQTNTYCGLIRMDDGSEYSGLQSPASRTDVQVYEKLEDSVERNRNKTYTSLRFEQNKTVPGQATTDSENDRSYVNMAVKKQIH